MSSSLRLLSDPYIAPETRQRALDRLHGDPGLPVSNPTRPFWLPDAEPYGNQASTQREPLPVEAEVVIIGSGITASSVARTLLQHDNGTGTNGLRRQAKAASHPAIITLEARALCSGATGRNGGHILDMGYEFLELEKRHGTERASAIQSFRLKHLDTLTAVAEESGLTEIAQVRRVESLSVHFEENVWKRNVRCIRRLKECVPEAAGFRIVERGDVPEEWSLPHAHGIIAGPAGALWPYKFVKGIFDDLLERYPGEILIEANTPVTAISFDDFKILPYSIETSRGKVQARHIIHCTNGHVGHLVPGLRGHTYPVREQMSAQTPGSQFRSQGSKHSWGFMYGGDFDYLTQLPGPSGEMMFGGGFSLDRDRGIEKVGSASDDQVSIYTDMHLSGALGAVFGHDNWGVGGVDMMWTGIECHSVDGVPWVGRLPDSLTGRSSSQEMKQYDGYNGSEWVCSSFQGAGMVSAWGCGEALGLMLLGDGYSEETDFGWLPKEMLLSEERIQRSKLPRNLEDGLEGQREIVIRICP